MNKAKYLTYSILIFIAFAFVGELSAWNLNGFEYRYMYVSFYLQKGQVQEDMLTDIEREAKDHNIDVFVVDREIKSALNERIDIYGMSNVEADMNDTAKVKEGSFESIILGKSTVKFHDFKDIPDVNKVEEYYIVGEYDDAYKFKQQLIDLYAGHFPRDVGYNEEMPFYISVTWIMAFALILLLNLYSISLIKKEVMLRVISGDSLKDIVRKRIGLDCIVYAVVFAIAFFILNIFTNADFYLRYSIGIFVGFLVLNTLLNMSLFRTNFKQSIMTNRSGKGVLRISYVYKTVTMLLVVIMMSSCIQLINLGVQWYRQKDFYEEYKNYSFVMVTPPFEADISLTDEYNYNYDFYLQYAEEGSAISLIDEGDFDGTGHDHIYANRGALPYLKEQIEDLNDMEFEEKVYMLVPERYWGDEDALSTAKELWDKRYINSKIETIEYKKNKGIISIDNQGNFISTIKNAPIILLNNTDEKNVEAEFGAWFHTNSALLPTGEDELNDYIANHEIKDGSGYLTNVYEAYMQNWQMLQRGMIIGLAILAIIFMLEVIIISTIIKYEFSINSVKLTLKRIMGYSLYERHKGIILLTLVAGVATTVIAAAILIYLKFDGIVYVLLGGLMVTALELIFIFINIRKFERSNVQRILKGGTL